MHGQLIQFRLQHVPVLTGTGIKIEPSREEPIKGPRVIHHFSHVGCRLSPLAVPLPEVPQRGLQPTESLLRDSDLLRVITASSSNREVEALPKRNSASLNAIQHLVDLSVGCRSSGKRLAQSYRCLAAEECSHLKDQYGY
jgi:hypothetical protein